MASSSWNKVTRLSVAGLVAPHLRDQANVASSRRVARVDKDGNVVGYTTLAEVQRALLEREQIELDVDDGSRPKEVLCHVCGRRIKVEKQKPVRKVCVDCLQPPCASCGAATAPRSGSMRNRMARNHRPALCRPCAGTGAVGQARKTSCKHGHEMTPENVYTTPGGVRQCLTCRRRYDADRKARRRTTSPKMDRRNEGDG